MCRDTWLPLIGAGGPPLPPTPAWVLLVEAPRGAARPQTHRLTLLAWEVQLAGATLIGLSTLQLEFGFGVPQFQLVFHPVLIALAASIALVPARPRVGPGGALAGTRAYPLTVEVPKPLLEQLDDRLNIYDCKLRVGGWHDRH